MLRVKKETPFGISTGPYTRFDLHNAMWGPIGPEKGILCEAGIGKAANWIRKVSKWCNLRAIGSSILEIILSTVDLSYKLVSVFWRTIAT